jgi:hypothetical protein
MNKIKIKIKPQFFTSYGIVAKSGNNFWIVGIYYLNLWVNLNVIGIDTIYI